ncbi:MAG: PAS-domain containing protein, partial [Notoacmeibacter sp.]|nr:PAS-domain containing protein [Notoacmeibacter sp.]
MASRTAADRTRDEFYTAFVKSLFENASTLLMGVLSQASIIALVYGRTGHPVYGVLLTALIGIGLIRFTVIRYYANHSATLTVELARKRELIYVISGALHGACLGAFTLISIYLVQDEFAEIASISVALATAISIPGRNYGSAWSVMVLLASVVLPISVGLILRGDIFHFVLGVFTLPIFLATRVFAMSVRGVLLKALTEQRKSTSLALRFDKALNTMTHGLVMIDANERVVVINQQALGLFSARSVDQMIGRSFSALLGRGVAAGLLDRRDARFISQQLSRAIREGRNRKVLIKLNDDRYFELSAREGDDELSVITFEDVSARIASQEKIRYMARFDSLTGLANRGHFQELVNEALANNNPERNCAVLVLDLDDFKSVNDTLGHP